MNSFFPRALVLCSALLFLGAGCFSLVEDDSITTTGPGGMFASQDKGESWTQISTLPTTDGPVSLAGVSVFRLFEDPQDPKAMYWGSRGDGLYFTYDQGKSWQKAQGALASGYIYSLAVDPKNKCLLYASVGQLVYRSDDCSRSWEEIHRENRTTARINALIISPSGDRLIMGKKNGEILQSLDQGETWSVLRRLTKYGVEKMIYDPLQEGVIYLATKNQGLLRSPDHGKKWFLFDEDLKSYANAEEYRGLYVHPKKEGVLYWTSTYGILKSEDGGETWAPYTLISSPGSADIYGFAINPNDDNEMYYAALRGGRSIFYITRDGGQTWSTNKMPSGQIPTVLRVHPDNGNIVYIGFTIPQQ